MSRIEAADDAYFSLLAEEDEWLPISDEKYADHLQLQEALISSVSGLLSQTNSCEMGISSKLVMIEKPNQFSITELGESSSSTSKTCASCVEPHHQFSVTVIGESPSSTSKTCAICMEPHQFPITEMGASYSSSSTSKTCDICFEPKSEEEFFRNLNCSHLFCSDCIGKHVASKIEENITVVQCPSCKSELDPELCKSILPVDVFNRWLDSLCVSVIPGSQRFYCPFKDCSGLLIDGRGGEDGEVITDSVCPHCNRLFCAACNVPWHSNFGCEEFQKLNEDERGKEDLMALNLAKEKEWKRCPVCRALVERIDGCLFMKCRCQTNFCYRCGGTLAADHYCPHCQRTW